MGSGCLRSSLCYRAGPKFSDGKSLSFIAFRLSLPLCFLFSLPSFLFLSPVLSFPSFLQGTLSSPVLPWSLPLFLFSFFPSIKNKHGTCKTLHIHYWEHIFIRVTLFTSWWVGRREPFIWIQLYLHLTLFSKEFKGTVHHATGGLTLQSCPFRKTSIRVLISKPPCFSTQVSTEGFMRCY